MCDMFHPRRCCSVCRKWVLVRFTHLWADDNTCEEEGSFLDWKINQVPSQKDIFFSVGSVSSQDRNTVLVSVLTAGFYLWLINAPQVVATGGISSVVVIKTYIIYGLASGDKISLQRSQQHFRKGITHSSVEFKARLGLVEKHIWFLNVNPNIIKFYKYWYTCKVIKCHFHCETVIAFDYITECRFLKM